MTRHHFLKSAGFGGAALLVLLTACSKTDLTPDSTGPVDFTLELSQPDTAALAKPNGFVVSNGVVVARSIWGTFVAATHTCSHEARQEVYFQTNEFYCNVHGARFDTAGKGLNSFGSRGLTVYKTELSGTSLRVFS